MCAIRGGAALKRYLIKRALQVIPTLFLVMVITFSIVMLLPGDPALAFLGEQKRARPDGYQRCVTSLGWISRSPCSSSAGARAPSLATLACVHSDP